MVYALVNIIVIDLPANIKFRIFGDKKMKK